MTLRFEPDVSHADWWATRDEPWQVLVSLGPSGFEAYAQVLMPLDEDARTALLPDVDGNLDDRTIAAVLGVLAAHTTTPDEVWSCLWDGYGVQPPGPRVRLPHRDHLLFRGALVDVRTWPLDVGGFVPPPAAVWPADRAWFLAFDVDPDWAGVGGSRQAIDALLADDRLQARGVAWGPVPDPREDAA